MRQSMIDWACARPGVRRGLWLGVVALAAVHGTAPARGLGVLRSGARCVAKEDAAILKECADATPDQADAIDRLTEGAIQSLLAVQYEAERAERRRQLAQDQPRAKDAGKALSNAIAQIERQWTEDVHLVLTAQQADGWLRFEKARRRLALYGVAVTGRVDLAAAVIFAGADEDDSPALKAALISWEDETDAAVKEWTAEAQTEVAYLSPEGQKKLERRRANMHAIAVANVRGCRAVAAALTDDQRARFVSLRMRAFASGISPVLSRAAITREVLSIPGLPASKREQVGRVVAEHQARVQEIAVNFLQHADEAVLADPEEAALPTLTDQAIAKANQVELSLEDALLALLSDAERVEYKKVPPVPYEWRGLEETGWRGGGPLEEPGAR